MYESPDQDDLMINTADDQLYLQMDLRTASDDHDIIDNTTASVINGGPQSNHHDHCRRPEFVRLISSEHLCAESPTMKAGRKSQTPGYGTQQPSEIVTSGLVTGRVSGDYDDAYAPYLPASTDAPSDVPAYYNQNPPIPNGTGCEDEPLLDLTGSGTDVDHCHAAVGSSPDTTANRRAQKQLIFAACVCFLFMVGELVGGWISGSLAIMTDAAHLLSDFTSFLISLFALWLARRPPTSKMSFGYFRAEILGAVISVLMIWVATGILVYLAVQRCITQNFDIDGKIMLITASCGLGVNILLALVLHFTGHGHSHGGLGHGHSHDDGGHDDGGHADEEDSHSHSNGHSRPDYAVVESDNREQPLSIQSEPLLAVDVEVARSHGKAKPKKSQSNMNVRAAFIHILGDLIQSVGVCIAAVIIIVQPEWKLADPICTFVFSVLVLVTTILILRDALQVLMEGVPRHINLHNLRSDLKSLPHVRMAHGLHVWSLTTSQAAMAVHLCIDAGEDAERVLQEASQLVRSRYNIIFSTIQVEHYQPEVMNNCGRCQEPGC